MATTLPKKGFTFWPVGTGDSTTISIRDDDIIMQIDLHHLDKSDDDDDPHCPIIDELRASLPKKNGKPYLSVFVLTHPDNDHIQGFDKLLKKVTIGEIWLTPRIFNEYKKDLCDDAKKFKEEALRRKNVTIDKDGDVDAGDRIRIIGHDEIFQDDEYKNFPEEWRTYPGNSITTVDGEDIEGIFEAFVHAPFKDDSAAERNNTSLALQISLKEENANAKALFFGDRQYPTIKQIFDKTKEKKRTHYLEWDLMLASHHCSKKVMYWKDQVDDSEKLKQDILDDFETYKLDGSYIVVSSESDFSDEEGKNPPHLKARKRYEEIVDSGHFLCTHEHPDKKEPKPIIFELEADGLSYQKPKKAKTVQKSALAAAISKARGDDEPPTEKVGFGSL
jgi:beta-lactamase superfamily II metal-dependent hydrolase